MRSRFETYTIYFGVDDEEKKNGLRRNEGW